MISLNLQTEQNESARLNEPVKRASKRPSACGKQGRKGKSRKIVCGMSLR